LALLTNTTGKIITIAVLGALTLYTISMISLIALRKKEPNLKRPFKVPLYPLAPILALIIAIASLFFVAYYNAKITLIYFTLLIITFVLFKLFYKTSSYD
jgi:ethanolamine permease